MTKDIFDRHEATKQPTKARLDAYIAVRELGLLTGDAEVNARIWRSVEAALDAFESTPASPTLAEVKSAAWDEGYAFAYSPDAQADDRPSWNPYKSGADQ